MTEETERDPRIMPASNIGEDVEAHYAELDLCEQLEPNEAFAVLKTGKNLKLLREICEDLSTPAKPFVVFEHDEVFEVRRLAKGRSAKRFYAYVGKPGKPSSIEKNFDENEEVRNAVLLSIQSVFSATIEQNQSYDAKFNQSWFEGKAFSHSMISRKTSGLAALRKSSKTATEALRTALQELVEEGILYEIPPSFAELEYKTSGKLYRLLK